MDEEIKAKFNELEKLLRKADEAMKDGWQQTPDQPDVSKNYVRHEDGRRGVILHEVGSHGDKKVVVCDTGAEEVWSYRYLTWLYLIPKEDW